MSVCFLREGPRQTERCSHGWTGSERLGAGCSGCGAPARGGSPQGSRRGTHKVCACPFDLIISMSEDGEGQYCIAEDIHREMYVIIMSYTIILLYYY